MTRAIPSLTGGFASTRSSPRVAFARCPGPAAVINKQSIQNWHGTIQCSVLLLLALGGWHPVQGKQRISQTKCQEYREANQNICSYPPISLIPDGSVHPGDYPFHAVFGFERVDQPSGNDSPYLFLSSAALISDRYVLTAAHSTRYELKQPVVVRLGATDLHGKVQQSYEDYEIEEVIRHPNYTARLAYHDIALVRLKEPVRFSRSIRPACLWDSMEMNFTSVEVTGFGFADNDVRHSARLQKYDLDVLKQASCEESFGRTRRFRNGIMEHQLCLAVAEHHRRRDSCQGDSGSPALVTFGSDGCAAVYVVGLGSHGLTCGVGGPETYTRVASFVDWIESVVWT